MLETRLNLIQEVLKDYNDGKSDPTVTALRLLGIIAEAVVFLAFRK